MHLPEAVAVEREVAVAHPLDDHRARATAHPFVVDDHEGGIADAGSDQVDRAGAREPLAERREVGERRHRERH